MQQHDRTFLDDLDTRIVVVTFEPRERAARYVADMHLSWPVLVDASRALYGAYGMLRGRRRDIWGPRSWWAYAKELLRGRVPEPARADISQLGGDVLIDPSGIVRLHHVGSGPADRPSIDTLLEARRRGMGQEPRGSL